MRFPFPFRPTQTLAFVCALLTLSPVAWSADSDGSWKFRLREHFDFHKLEGRSGEFDFNGTSNTLNFWYEKPFKRAIGVSFGPILGNAKINDDATSTEFGGKIQQFTLGVEWKEFLLEQLPLFSRLGTGVSILNTEGTADGLFGSYLYAGIGWEFKVGGLGIAPEIAFRQAFYESGVKAQTFTPSIGFHFYMLH